MYILILILFIPFLSEAMKPSPSDCFFKSKETPKEMLQMIATYYIHAASDVDKAKDNIALVLQIPAFNSLRNDRQWIMDLHAQLHERFKKLSKKEEMLWMAIRKGMVSMLPEFYHPSINPRALSDGKSALHHAVEHLCVEAIEQLLMVPLNPNAKDKAGYMPLQILVMKFKDFTWCSISHKRPLDALEREPRHQSHHDEEVIKAERIAILLVKAGAKLNSKKFSPIDTGALSGWVAMVKFFIAHGAKVTSWFEKSGKLILVKLCEKWIEDAQCDCYREIPRMYLQAKVKLNWRDKKGETVLFDACEWEKVEIMRMLLEHGADVKIRNKAHESVLMHAIKHGTAEHVALLKQYGAEL